MPSRCYFDGLLTMLVHVSLHRPVLLRFDDSSFLVFFFCLFGLFLRLFHFDGLNHDRFDVEQNFLVT